MHHPSADKTKGFWWMGFEPSTAEPELSTILACTLPVLASFPTPPMHAVGLCAVALQSKTGGVEEAHQST